MTQINQMPSLRVFPAGCYVLVAKPTSADPTKSTYAKILLTDLIAALAAKVAGP